MADSVANDLSSDEKSSLAEKVNPTEETPRDRLPVENVDMHENESTKVGSLVGYSAPVNENELHDEKEVQNNPEISELMRIGSQAPMAIKNIQTPSSFAQLVRTWETYMKDDTGDQFEPLQVFQQLNLCGTGEGLARLTARDAQSNVKLLEPAVFRHTHSTPVRHTPSILDDDDEDEPSPVGLEILNRSRSTPLSMSANSAFGTTLRMPYLSGPADRSAFTLPPYRLKPTFSSDRVTRHTTFNPIKCDKEMDAESTSIEVMDLPTRKSLKDPPATKTLNEETQQPPARRITVSRAARFLSDVRNLRRRRLIRGGRENPARPPSSSDDSGKKTDVADEETNSSESSTNSSERKFKSSPGSKTKGPTGDLASETNPFTIERSHDGKSNDANSSEATSYHQLDSDQDEDGEPFRRTDISMGVDSPSTISSPVYLQMEDDHPSSLVNRVHIQVSNSTKDSILLSNTGAPPYSIASPVPAQMARDASTLTPHSEDSPETSRCSATTYTSGHTTQATSTTYSSGHLSHLSSISETDREVMEANKAGTLLRQDHQLPTTCKDDALLKIIPLSSSRNARYAGYIELANSPVPLRDGASVPAERFFKLAESQGNEKRGLGRLRTSSSLRKSTSQSPTTVSSSSMNTNSSASSAGDEPPTFVSYLDGKTTSDLTSLRESVEASSSRAGDEYREQRESDVIFEEAQAPRNTTSKKPFPIWPTKGLQFGRRVRSLPPRSPLKGARTPTTPPPRGRNESLSPAYSGVSPPRNIVNHRIDPNVSRPFVLRTTASTRLMPGHKVSSEVPSSSGNVNYTHIPGVGVDQGEQEVVRVTSGYEMSRSYCMTLPRGSSPVSRTYDEYSIEILKTDSKEESSPTFVTPGKGTASNELA